MLILTETEIVNSIVLSSASDYILLAIAFFVAFIGGILLAKLIFDRWY